MFHKYQKKTKSGVEGSGKRAAKEAVSIFEDDIYSSGAREAPWDCDDCCDLLKYLEYRSCKSLRIARYPLRSLLQARVGGEWTNKE